MATTNQSASLGTEGQRDAGNPSLIKRMVNDSLKSFGYKLTRSVPRTKLVCTNFPGWFSIEEAEQLYMLAAASSAPRFLEIGHFLGRSTSAICEGIRDAGNPVQFNSYDLGFTSADEFIAHFKRVHDTASSQVPKEYEDLVYSQKKTTTEIARANLARFGLDGFVTLISGDFVLMDKTRYGFIFCDALHDHKEIAMNLPHVMAASNDDCLWAFHDMNPANVADVLSLSTARLIRVVDTLGIFRFQRQAAAARGVSF